MLQIAYSVFRIGALVVPFAALALSISSGTSAADSNSGRGIEILSPHTQLAQTAAPQSPGQPPTGSQQKSKPSGKTVTPVEPIDTQIANLHKRLGITSAQEPMWADVAQAMHDEAKLTEAYFKQRAAAANSMTAIEDLNSYQQFAQTRADALKKIAASFETLYASMPDNQKKTADKVFRDFQRHGPRGSASKSAAPKSN